MSGKRMTFKELQEYLGVTEYTLRRMIKSGDIPYLQVNGRGRYYFDPELVETALASAAVYNQERRKAAADPDDFKEFVRNRLRIAE